MTENKLQLIDGKTEALIIYISSQKSSSLPQSIGVGQDEIKFAESVRNLGIIFDSKLSITDQVNKICRLTFLELHRIGSIRHLLSLSVEVIQTRVTSCAVTSCAVTSRVLLPLVCCCLSCAVTSRVLLPLLCCYLVCCYLSCAVASCAVTACPVAHR